MRRRTGTHWLVILVIAAGLALGPATPTRAGWKFGDTRYFTAEQVCRDGIVVLAGWDKENSGGLPPPAPGDTSSIPLGARLYTNTEFAVNPFPEERIEAYGPLLARERTVLMTYHEEPLVADINDNGSFVITFNVYARETWFWSQLLNVGQTVLLHEGNIILDAPVEDCFLHRPTVMRGSSGPITGTHLTIDPLVSQPAETVYTIESLPAHGQLLLDGVVAAIGATFTQADLETGRLRYANDGNAATTDSFNFSVRGLSRVSVTADGSQVTGGGSTDPSISADGLAIAFESTATDLVRNDTNGQSDIFVRYTDSISTTRVSLTGTGAQALGGGAINPSISASAREVAFESTATNMNATDCLVYPASTDAARDVYRWSFGNVRQMSQSDERYGDCYRGNGDSAEPAMASDGFTVVFQTAATDMLAEINGGVEQGPPDANGTALDIFNGGGSFMQLLSRASGFLGTQADDDSRSPSVSEDGDTFAYESLATNLLGAGGDTNGISDIYVRTSSNNTVRVSVSTAGAQATSTAQTCIPAFPNPICVTLGSYNPDISPNGRFVAFHSYASNLVGGDADTIGDIFVRDRDTDNDGVFDEPGAVSTRIVSVASNGTQGNANSFDPSISANGRFVAFRSSADNLVTGDLNGTNDIFVHDRDFDGDGIFDEPGAIRTTRVSVAIDGTEANGSSDNPSISYDGAFVAFDSAANNLVPRDTNGQRDIFVAYTGFRSTLQIEIVPAVIRLPLVANPSP